MPKPRDPNPLNWPTWLEHAELPATPEDMADVLAMEAERINDGRGLRGEGGPRSWLEDHPAAHKLALGIVLLLGIRYSEVAMSQRRHMFPDSYGRVWDVVLIDPEMVDGYEFDVG